MVALVTLERARSHLRLTHITEDDEVAEKIEEASDIVVAYLKDRANQFLDTSGEVVPELVPPRVRAAVLYMLGVLWKDRDNANPPSWDPYSLPRPVVALLHPMRTPTIA